MCNDYLSPQRIVPEKYNLLVILLILHVASLLL